MQTAYFSPLQPTRSLYSQAYTTHPALLMLHLGFYLVKLSDGIGF